MAETERTRPPLIFKFTVRAPQSTVFDAFFKKPQSWLCREARIEPRIGGDLLLGWPDSEVEGRFVAFDPPRTGRFTWHFVGDSLPATMVVVWVVAAQRDGRELTDVEVEHYGFGSGTDWDMEYTGCARAWAGYVKNLRAVLEAGLDLREADE